MLLKITRLLATAAAASLLLVGCGDEESTSESQDPVARPAPKKQAVKPPPRNTIVEKLAPDGKSMHLTATDPKGKEITASIGDEIDLPEQFPKDVPIFPDSTPMAFLFSPGEGIIVTFKSVEKQQDIFDFYESSLTDDGWEILENQTQSTKLSFEAIKEGRKVAVTVTGKKGDSRVSVIVTPEN